MHVVNSERWLHLWFLVRCRLQCAMNKQLMSIGGEIALSGNRKTEKKKEKKKELKNFIASSNMIIRARAVARRTAKCA